MGRLIMRLALGIATVLAITVLEPLKSGDEALASMILAMTAGLLVARAVW
jgi:glucose-6-phosphate-specific signal transduction histidine kinase